MSTVPPSARRLLPACASLVLTVALFLVPVRWVAGRGYAGEGALVTAAERAFVQADASRPVGDSTTLAELTALWREFHVVKAVIAVLLFVTLGVLATRVRRHARAAGRRRRLSVTAYAGVVTWALGALTVLLANVQGALAPLASVASFLPPGGGGPELDVVRGRLRAAAESGPPARVGGVGGDLLRDFTFYHAVFAVLALVTSAALVVLALRAVRQRWRHRGGRTRPTGWLVDSTLYGAAGGVFLLLSLANLSTWLDPVPAFVASLGGA